MCESEWTANCVCVCVPLTHGVQQPTSTHKWNKLIATGNFPPVRPSRSPPARYLARIPLEPNVRDSPSRRRPVSDTDMYLGAHYHP